jgi:iron complex outermembrane receptor protein
MADKFCSYGYLLRPAGMALALLTASIPWSIARSDNATGDEATSTNSLEEVVVTARKREESVMRTPVTIDVVTEKQIEDLKIVDLYDLSQTLAPDLKVSYGFGPVGTVVFMRGIGSGDTASYVDQSVGLNIDGVSMSQGTFYNAGSFDLAQVELLKGPQGLFFGKSTTAGIIALHTADPTPDWQTMVSYGDEFVANEHEVNMFVSGPITDKLGIRLAGYYDSNDGWLYNPNPAASDHRLPNSEDFAGRLTLKWDDPDTGLRVRFKAGAFNDYSHSADGGTMNQGFGCPIGVRQSPLIAPYDNCRLDEYTQGYGNAPPYNPNLPWATSLGNPAPFAEGTQSPLMGDGRPYAKTQTVNSALQIDYDLTHDITLTSVTGYDFVDAKSAVRGGFGFDSAYDVASNWEETDLSEEFRVTSDWKNSPVNFMLGGLYATTYSSNTEWSDIPSETVWGAEYLIQKSDMGSGFAQLIFTPIDQLEIAPGVRYTHVYKYFPNLQVFNNFPIPGNSYVNQAPLVPMSERAFAQDNTSPEVTVTYHATADWTIYGSYKQGYKGPGFNAQTFLLTSFNPAIVPTGAISPFGGERVQGVEGGIKGVLLDRHLNVSITPYYYKYLSLQVSNLNYLTHAIEVTNGADAKTYGVELSADYAPPVEGLKLTGYLAYNRAEFTSFPLSPCWGGQTSPEGCLAGGSGATAYTYQNLGGQTPYEAPHWAGAFGVSYDQPIQKFVLGYTANASFSSGYYTVADLLPDSWQTGWVTMDASVHLSAASNAWSVALIGRNLTNRLYVLGASDYGTVTPGVMADAFGYTNRARQVMLQFTVRPNKLF